jgi:hypothetical protein
LGLKKIERRRVVEREIWKVGNSENNNSRYQRVDLEYTTLFSIAKLYVELLLLSYYDVFFARVYGTTSRANLGYSVSLFFREGT